MFPHGRRRPQSPTSDVSTAVQSFPPSSPHRLNLTFMPDPLFCVLCALPRRSAVGMIDGPRDSPFGPFCRLCSRPRERYRRLRGKKQLPVAPSPPSSPPCAAYTPIIIVMSGAQFTRIDPYYRLCCDTIWPAGMPPEFPPFPTKSLEVKYAYCSRGITHLI